MQNFKKIAILIAAAAAMSACTSPPVEEKPPVVEAPVAQPAPEPREVAPVEAPVVDPLDDPNSPLAKRSVYFDFDSYVVRDDGKPVVEAHSGYLTKNADRKILIQGNTDERGGTEYNLALGQKRAEAVRSALQALGVSSTQMEAVSLGEEKPKATGHDESAWAENRRADIVY